jgi:hypothetical protein
MWTPAVSKIEKEGAPAVTTWASPRERAGKGMGCLAILGSPHSNTAKKSRPTAVKPKLEAKQAN